MNIILIGNAISLLGCIVMVSIGFIRSKKNILLLQCLQFGLMGAANLVLGATTGFIAGLIGILRNVVCMRRPATPLLKVLFILLQLVLSLPALSGDLVSWVPIFSAVIFTWFIDLKSDVALKFVMIIAQAAWIFYDFHYMNYVSLAFDIFTVLSHTFGILMILRSRRTVK